MINKETTMNWSQKEKVIREKRTMEAVQKNLMGVSGKLGLIAKTFGYPIVRQGSGLNDITYLDDPYEDFVESEKATMISEQDGPETSHAGHAHRLSHRNPLGAP